MSPATSKPAAPIEVENVNVSIMGRDYAFACAPDERASLLECVGIVDRKMTTIKSLGKLTAVDRIAVMAALTIANEFTTLRDSRTTDTSTSRPGLDFGPLEPTISSLNVAIGDFLTQFAAVASSESDSLALPFSPRSNTP